MLTTSSRRRSVAARRCVLLAVGLACPWLLAGAAAAQVPAAAPPLLPAASEAASRPGSESPPATGAAVDGLQQLAIGVLRRELPIAYENTKQWGLTEAMTKGVQVERDGWKVRLRRVKEQVNHGAWKMYRLWLLDPADGLQIDISELREAGPGRVAFDVDVRAFLGLHGRWAEWRRGVQLWSVSAEGEAIVHLRLTCEVAVRFDLGQLPPAVILEPRVMSADVVLDHFRLARVSQLHGPVVRELSSAVRQVLEEELAERREQLAERLNEQIAKHPDKLRLSLAELAASNWRRLLEATGRTAAEAPAPVEAFPTE